MNTLILNLNSDIKKITSLFIMYSYKKETNIFSNADNINTIKMYYMFVDEF